MVSLNQEVDFDGWAWCAAIRFLANAGGIHDSFLQAIPYWPPGVATPDCPFYTLKRGSGARPASLHYRQEIIWTIMQEITTFLSDIDPATGFPAPYYLGFDPYRQLHCEPISFYSKQPSAFYSTDIVATNGGNPIRSIEVFTSVDQMRSSIDLYGIDPRSNELLYLHQGQAPSVLKTMGYPVPLTQQSPMFVSDDFMNYVATAYSIQTGIPTQTVRLVTDALPWVSAGQTGTVWSNETNGIGVYKWDSVRHKVQWNPDGTRENIMICEGRNVLNTL
jgi:hypothetical protein